MLQILVMHPEHKEFKILKYFYDHTMWEEKAVKLLWVLRCSLYFMVLQLLKCLLF